LTGGQHDPANGDDQRALIGGWVPVATATMLTAMGPRSVTVTWLQPQRIHSPADWSVNDDGDGAGDSVDGVQRLSRDPLPMAK